MESKTFSRPRAWLLLLLGANVLGAVSVVAPCQCGSRWIPGPGINGAGGFVYASTEWDPDGAGPLAPRVVIGGTFVAAGDAPATNIATFDPATGSWSALGNGVGGFDAVVRALAVLPNGDLVAGGAFPTPATGAIARWDGVAWTTIGAANHVRALAVLPNGDLVAAGSFASIGGVVANGIARWNGLAWSGIGSGLQGGANALLVLANGDLIVGGGFTTAGGLPANNIARWNGASWSSLGAGTNGAVRALTSLPNGDVSAAGPFTTAGGVAANGIARWNGSTWSPVPGAYPAISLGVLPGGDLVAGFDGAVYRFGGGAPALLGDVEGVVETITTLANGKLVVGGWIESIDTVNVASVASWNGAGWSQLGSGVPWPALVAAVTALHDGDVVLQATYHEGPAALLRWNGSSLTSIGDGSNVATLATATNGDVVAGGWFTSMGAVVANRIARWNGASWSGLGTGMNGSVRDVLPLPNGDVLACGEFTNAGGMPADRVARWNGSQWSAVGSGLPNYAFALEVTAAGEVVVGGTFAPSTVVRWTGSAWVPLGQLQGVVHDLARLPGGDLVAVGDLGAPFHGVARWDGTAWLALAGGLSNGTAQMTASAVEVLPDGDVVVGGRFDLAGGVPVQDLARWDGTAWSPLARVVGGKPTDLARAPDGTLVVGSVLRVDGVVSAGFAQLRPSCRAAAVWSAAGCAGSGGPDVLAATSLPWTHSTYRALASGLPTSALALDVYGFVTVAVPLAVVAPQGLPGCTLGVAPDFVATLVPVGGAATTALTIPDTAALAGLVLHQQVVALDLAAGGALVAVTASNRLTLTVGTL